ncbi:MAG: hypothetical protein QOJ99_4692 [Bryobacterales bacterium]|nr:hypothetical protein [Bryobacterales bacterium]
MVSQKSHSVKIRTARTRLDSNSVAQIVKRAGLDPALYAGHSLGADFCTHRRISNGVPELAIMRQSRPSPRHGAEITFWIDRSSGTIQPRGWDCKKAKRRLFPLHYLAARRAEPIRQRHLTQ